MDPSYVNVMDPSELLYIALVYGIHGVVAGAQAALAAVLVVTGARGLRDAATPNTWAGARIALGALLVAPLVLGAPAFVSIAAAVLGGVVLLAERGAPPVAGVLGRAVRATAIAAAAVAAAFMVWEREDNLVLGVDLLAGTVEWRDEEVAWQQDNDPQSPKVG